MKKILFATSALVATAGLANAEISGSGPGNIDITGSAEIGVIGGNRYTHPVVPRSSSAEFWTDVEVFFTMTGEADNGLTFGAKVDLDEGFSGFNTDDNGATWFVAFGSARLDMGDTDGAFDWAMQETNLVGGSIDDSETWHPGFSGNSGLDGNAIGASNADGQIARFTYTFGDFAAALSAEVDDSPDFGPNDGGTVWGLGATYSGDLGGITLGVGIGYQNQDNVGDIIGFSIDAASGNGLSAAVNYSEFNPDSAIETATFDDNVTHWSIGFGYEMNALSLGINYGEWDNALGLGGGYTVGNNAFSSTGYGAIANYDLGGGLVVQAGLGIGEQKVGGAKTDFDSFSLGLAMSF